MVTYQPHRGAHTRALIRADAHGGADSGHRAERNLTVVVLTYGHCCSFCPSVHISHDISGTSLHASPPHLKDTRLDLHSRESKYST
eukprot:82366-Pelagomonas_calceolata.AAC.1